jgi:hypothetical protein
VRECKNERGREEGGPEEKKRCERGRELNQREKKETERERERGREVSVSDPYKKGRR